MYTVQFCPGRTCNGTVDPNPTNLEQSMLSLLLVVIVLLQWTRFCSSIESLLHTASAFCQSYPPQQSFNGVYHPTPVPEMHIPWVWEAVFDPVLNNVDISIITPNACAFNQTAWKMFSERFPNFEKYVGGGLASNVLVSSECEANRPRHLHHLLGILRKRFMCVFHGKGRYVHRVLSYKVHLKVPTFGPLIVRCPVPPKLQFDSIQLEVRDGFSPFCVDRFGTRSIGFTNTTRIFPVCKLPMYDSDHKNYKLSVISATARADETKMVEWIEYHRLMGVQHFFLYNTAVGVGSAEAINRMLSGYVKEGVVTVIPWHFMNCVRGMASGRSAYYYVPNHNYNPNNPASVKQRSSYDMQIFRPPHPIANYAALMSGYSRFRHTSKYMLYIDDDEFVSFFVNSGSSSSSDSLVTLADRVFTTNPNSSAIYLHPIDMGDCPDNDKRAGRSSDTSSRVLPRVGNQLYGFVGDYNLYEHKLLMRTDAVTLFSVHYISLLEANFYNESIMPNAVSLPLNETAILHYKVPAHISGDPFSFGSFLATLTNVTQSYRCKESHRVVDPYQKGLWRNVDITGHVLPATNMKKLEERVSKRLHSPL